MTNTAPTRPARTLSTKELIVIWNTRPRTVNRHYFYAIGRELIRRDLLTPRGWQCGELVAT